MFKKVKFTCLVALLYLPKDKIAIIFLIFLKKF
jgi:hypothetical protein